MYMSEVGQVWDSREQESAVLSKEIYIQNF